MLCLWLSPLLLTGCCALLLLLMQGGSAGPARTVSGHECIFVTADLARGWDNRSCWGGGEERPCASVSLALQGVLVTSNDTWHPWVCIEPGSHELNESIVFDGEERQYLKDIGIVGIAGSWTPGNNTADELLSPSAIISCSNFSKSGLTFLNINSSITLKNISIDKCGTLQNSTSTVGENFVKFYVALYFLFCNNLHFQNVWVNHSVSAGVVVYAACGVNVFTNCTFLHNRYLNSSHGCYGGAFFLEFPYCNPNAPFNDCNQTISTSCTNSSFHFEGCDFAENQAKTFNRSDSTFIIPGGHRHMALGRGGGLSLYFKGNISHSSVSMQDCKFSNNAAIWGGGIFVEFQDNSHNNTFTVNSSYFEGNSVTHNIIANEGSGGGGLRADYILEGVSQPGNNSMVFSDCHFKSNTAYFGGGVSFLGGRESSVSSSTNHIQFIRCQWRENTAMLGAAIDLSWWHPVTSGVAVEVNLVNSTICYHGQHSNLQAIGSLVGLGAMYIDSLPVVFEGYVLFDNNEQTALAATDAQIEFRSGCNVTFTNNVGRYGGAMSLTGSTFLRAFDHTAFHFKNNVAFEVGGAIFYSALGSRYLLSSRTCFIRYFNVTELPQDWLVSFNFINNSDSTGNNSIYTTSLIPCVWGGGEAGPYDPASINTTFCWSNWTYGTGCKNEIATNPATFHVIPINPTTIFPGERKQLHISLQDDLGTNARNVVLTATSVDTNIAKVDSSSKYMYDGTLKLQGKTGKEVAISLYTLAPRVVYTQINVKLSECPPGFNYLNESCICAGNGLSHKGMVQCFDDDGEFSSQLIREGTWIGRLGSDAKYVAGNSPFTFSRFSSSTQKLNYGDLEGNQCIKQNRTGVLCSQCKDNYCPAINSWAYRCVERSYNVAVYVILELIPLTVVFIVLLVFNVRLTSGPANAFIFFSQTITATFSLYYIRELNYRKLTEPWVVVYSVWNLRFQEIIPGYCVHGIDGFAAVIALEYVSAVYPLVLIAIFYFVTSLYNRGLRPVMYVCGPIHRCVARLRMNTLNRTVTDALAAFLLLSYTKFTIISLKLLSPSPLYDIGGTPNATVMYYDGTIEYFTKNHVPYIVAALFSLLFIVTLPPLLLLLYPLRIFHKALPLLSCQRCRLGGRLELFLNAFYGCYKDGIEAGTRDYRYFAGLYFVFRVVFAIVNSAVTEFNTKYLIQQVLCIVGILLFAVPRPYRKDFYNNLDASMFALLALINAFSSYDYSLSKSPKLLPGQIVLIWLPMLYILSYLIYYVWTTYGLRQRLSQLCHRKLFRPELTERVAVGGIGDDSLMQLVDDRAQEPPPQPVATHSPRPSGGESSSETRPLVLSDPLRWTNHDSAGRDGSDSGHAASPPVAASYGSTDHRATGLPSGAGVADSDRMV